MVKCPFCLTELKLVYRNAVVEETKSDCYVVKLTYEFECPKCNTTIQHIVRKERMWDHYSGVVEE